MKKRFWAKGISVMMVVMMLPSMAISVRGGFVTSDNTKFLAPIGSTAAGSIPISDRAGLEAIRNNLRGTYHLTNNIDLSGAEWQPIAFTENAFSGVFDGQGYVIKNMKITGEQESYCGLFGLVDGTIKNVGLENTLIDVTGERSWAIGGVVGFLRGSVENCYNSGKINAECKSADVGGLVGSSFSSASSIRNCYNLGSVNASTYGSGRAGGIAGYSYGNIQNCYNSATINCFVSSNADAVAGGIVGSGQTVENCYNNGTVTASTSGEHSDNGFGSNSYAGGVAGEAGSSANISKCYNTGEVKSAYSYWAYAGGIAGHVESISTTSNGAPVSSKSKIELSYNTGNVSASASSHSAFAGGIAGYGSANGNLPYTEVTVESCYNKGAVTSNSYRANSGGIFGTTVGIITIRNCFNMGGIKSFDANASCAGGLVGDGSSSSPMSIMNCYNTGTINATATSMSFFYPGGIVGNCSHSNASTMDIKNCYYLDNIRTAFGENRWSDGPSLANVRLLTNAEMLRQDSYVGYDFSSVWGINSTINKGYPYLLKLEAPADNSSAPSAKPSEQYTYYVDKAVLYGLVPNGFELSQNVTAKDFYEFMLKFVQNKCYFDVDGFIKSKGKTVPNTNSQKAVLLQELLAIPISSDMLDNQVLTQEQVVYYFGEYLRAFAAPFSPLLFNADAPTIRYNFMDYQHYVYSDNVVSALMSEIISLSRGNDINRNSYSPKDNLTREQLAAMSYMLSTMTIPKDMSGKYAGGLTSFSDTDEYIEKILDSIITPGMTAEKKVMAVYTYMAKNYTHDDSSVPWLLTSGGINPLAVECDLFMPLFMTNKGTCDTFASGLRMLLLRLGYECNYVSGQYVNRDGSKVGHGWNQVKINDEWYWLDVDVEGTTFKKSGTKEPSYFLFLKKDDFWLTNHSWIRDAYPACNTTKYPMKSFVNAPSAWAQEGVASAIKRGFVPADVQFNYQSSISRAEFCRMAIKWVENVAEKNIDAVLSEKGVSRNTSAFSDTKDPDILAAFALGITSGTGSGKFTPNGQLSREQAATMIMNTCKVIGGNVGGPLASGFADIDTASSWAIYGINFVCSQTIMQGTGNNKFSPKASFTREQGIVTFNNIKYNELLER